MNANSAASFPTPAGQRLLLTLTIPGRIPSWNALLAMGHWQRAKAKKKIQDEFISALSLSANASAIPTILVRSGCSTLSGIAELFEMTRQRQSPSKPRSAKQRKARPSTRKSKSTRRSNSRNSKP
jgi:hypothetical protein